MDEYKKVEAQLELEFVKDMIISGDYANARGKLLEIKHIFPDLDDLNEMFNVCDILYSANFEFLDCSKDWYWVLQVTPNVDQSLIQYQYNKIKTLLDPIKENFPGTKIALETIREAFLVLSDVEKRIEYDKKRVERFKEYESSNESSISSNGDFYNFENIRKVEVFSIGQIWASYDKEHLPRIYVWINDIDTSPFKMYVTWLEPAPIIACERKWCDVGLPVACGFFEKTHQTVMNSLSKFSHMMSQFTNPNENIEIYPKKNEIWAIYDDWKPIEWTLNPESRHGSKLRIVEILKGYSNHKDDMLVVDLVKVKEFESVFKRYSEKGMEKTFTIPGKYLYMFSHSIPRYRFVGGERNEIFEGMFYLDPMAVPENLNCIDESNEILKLNSKNTKTLSKRFVSDEIWAIKDDFDSMSRQYAIVEKLTNDEVRVTLLEPNLVLDDEIYWVEQKLPIVCGSFKLGKTHVNVKFSKFSHLVNCEKIANRSLFYEIYPKKGEIWAIYKNWNTKWKFSDFRAYSCGIVEIISDFCEETGIIVACLEEVPGFATFFRRKITNGFELVRFITRVEMLGFSHQIPAFVVPGIEVYGVNEGSWHLEADALPPNHGKIALF